MKSVVIALALLCLTGCATIRRHPIITGVVVGIVATSIALSVSHHDEHEPPAGYHPTCGNNCAWMGAPVPPTVGGN